MIVYTCPKCGGDLVDYVIATYPPIQAKKCLRCGWRWESQPAPICRLRFDPPKESTVYESIKTGLEQAISGEYREETATKEETE